MNEHKKEVNRCRFEDVRKIENIGRENNKITLKNGDWLTFPNGGSITFLEKYVEWGEEFLRRTK